MVLDPAMPHLNNIGHASDQFPRTRSLALGDGLSLSDALAQFEQLAILYLKRVQISLGACRPEIRGTIGRVFYHDRGPWLIEKQCRNRQRVNHYAHHEIAYQMTFYSGLGAFAVSALLGLVVGAIFVRCLGDERRQQQGRLPALAWSRESVRGFTP